LPRPPQIPGSAEPASLAKIPAFKAAPFPAEIQFFTESETRGRRLRFLGSELVILICLGLLVRFGLSLHFADHTILALLGILGLALLIAAIAVPIAFVRNNPARMYRR